MASNIFSQSIAYVESQSFPILPSWLYPWLIVLGALRLIMVFSCIAIFSIPFSKGPASRRKNLWLIRRKYSRSRIPYLVPNRPMMVVLCELLSGLMYFTLACLNYASFKSPEIYRNSKVIVWYGASLLPSYLGIWLGGWGLLYSCLGPGATSSVAPNRFIKPTVYNSFYISWCILVSLVTGLWAVLNGRKADDLFRHLDELLQLLIKGEESFDSNPLDISQNSLSALQKGRETVQKNYSQFTTLIQNWTLSWIVFELFLVTFYVFILYHLHQNLKRLLKLCKTQEELLMNHAKSYSASESTFESKQVVDESSMALTALRKELRFIALFNFSISLVLLCEIGVLCFQLVCSKHLTDPDWLALTSILVMTPSTFMSPVLLLQCWRIFTERSVSEYSASTREAKLAPQGTQIQFHDQLLEWYVGSQLEDSDVFDTFSGVVELPNSPTNTEHFHSKRFSTRFSKTSSPTVKVTKRVTVDAA